MYLPVLFVIQNKLNRFIAKTTISVVKNDRFVHKDKDTKQNKENFHIES